MRRRLVRIMVIFGMFLLIPSVSANCISYGFFNDENINHRSFLMSNGYHFGNELFVETNCETQIIINGEVKSITNSTATLFVPSGIHNIELKSENSSRNYSSVLVQGGSFLDNAIQLNNSIYSEDKIQISVEDLDSSKVFVAIGNSLILFILITVVYWRVINIYTDRYYFEEVIS